ncbi:MFS transporter [Aciditerrimonas ferrireducens]|uniref:MFS transporter n=1 Tax=Aciditerrimonas ferrireducens TaxID=667306 RepID=A0ABV6C4V8_9ACTN
MSQTVAATGRPQPGLAGTLRRVLLDRELPHYPSTGKRVWYLAIVVAATVILYYEAYAPGSVSPLVLAHYHMTFSFYLYSTIVGSAFGAISALIAHLGDRIGRANLVVAGVGIVAFIQLFAVPNMPNEWTFVIALMAIGFVEGVVLVCTPALVRDFSPQAGRASAMGFWTIGPVAGSLLVSVVANHTLPIYHDWESQFIISGIAGMGMFLVALLFLRELSPEIRDQLMVSAKERTLVEIQARGIDPKEATAHPWRQMLSWDLIGSSFAISVFLLIYFAAVGFFTIYFTTTFHNRAGVYLSTSQANGINTWFWGLNCIMLVVVGLLSDRLRVRKPFMIVGALGGLAMTIVFLEQATNPYTSYDTLVVITSVLASFLAIGYVTWMASFTETVEAHNPALVATGIAVWGWILRAVVAISTLVVALTVTSVTTIVNQLPYAKDAPKVKAILAQHGALVALAQKHAALLREAAAHPHNLAIVTRAAAAVGGLSNLLAIAKLGPQLSFLSRVGPHLVALQHALAVSPSQWQHWYWVCAAGFVVFIPFVFLMKGRWSPAKAAADLRQREAEVEARLAALRQAQAGAGSTGAGEPGALAPQPS